MTDDPTAHFVPVARGDAPGRYVLDVTNDLCVGPVGNIFMFGGAGLAAGIRALEMETGRELIWATAQYVSYARPGAHLNLVVEIAQAGRNVAQARVTVTNAGETILTVTGALGERAGHPDVQWETMPDMPPPEECVDWRLWPPQDSDARMNERLDFRFVPGRFGARPRDGTPSEDGRMRFWIRPKEPAPMDAALVAIFADYVPSGAGAALGRVGGGNSLDNTVRIRRIVPSDWMLCDVHIQAMARGFVHGDMRLFARDGTLVATGGQSMILRLHDKK